MSVTCSTHDIELTVDNTDVPNGPRALSPDLYLCWRPKFVCSSGRGAIRSIGFAPSVAPRSASTLQVSGLSRGRREARFGHVGPASYKGSSARCDRGQAQRGDRDGFVSGSGDDPRPLMQCRELVAGPRARRPGRTVFSAPTTALAAPARLTLPRGRTARGSRPLPAREKGEPFSTYERDEKRRPPPIRAWNAAGRRPCPGRSG